MVHDEEAARAFVAFLCKLREQAGSPSYNEIGRRSDLTGTTIARMFAGNCPSWTNVMAVVRGLGHEPDSHLQAMWRKGFRAPRAT